MGEANTFKWQEVEKFLLHVGCEFKRQSGSHRIYKKTGVIKLITIPVHKEVSIGVISQTLKNLNIDRSEFLEVVKKL